MLDREAIEEFFDSEMEYLDLEIPGDIAREALIEAFYNYIEAESYEWLRNSFASFFNNGDPDWDAIREQMEKGEEY